MGYSSHDRKPLVQALEQYSEYFITIAQAHIGYLEYKVGTMFTGDGPAIFIHLHPPSHRLCYIRSTLRVMTITQNSASGIRRPSTKPPGCSGSCQIELKNIVLELQGKIHRLCREFITENGLDFEIDSEEEDKQGNDKNYPHDG